MNGLGGRLGPAVAVAACVGAIRRPTEFADEWQEVVEPIEGFYEGKVDVYPF